MGMAKIERYINENFDQLLSKIENGIINGSMSATLEDASDFRSGTARCSVRVFERYSYAGGNRVSLNITLFKMTKIQFNFPQLQREEAKLYFSKLIHGGKRHFLIS
mgnify:CR=1 FL=1